MPIKDLPSFNPYSLKTCLIMLGRLASHLNWVGNVLIMKHVNHALFMLLYMFNCKNTCFNRNMENHPRKQYNHNITWL